MGRLLAVGKQDIAQVLSLAETIIQAEEGYKALHRGNVDVPAVQHLENPEVEGEFDVKSAFLRAPGPYASVKVATGFFQNHARGLPTSHAVILLLDGATGAPLAIVDGDLITNWRTGAAAAVATKHLSNPTAASVGLIGSGVIAGMALRAICQVRPIRRAWVWAPPVEMREEFARVLTGELGLPVLSVDSPREAVSQADVVVTATPSRAPIVDSTMIRPGTHINAIGADAPGKQELDAALTASAKLVVDRLAQCRSSGELQHALRQGLMEESEVHSEIGAILCGAAPGRTSTSEITIFDATGVAALDIAVTALVYEQARLKGLGTWVEL